MKTFQDFEKAPVKEQFILDAISEHKASAEYRTAIIAHDYASHRNTTINQFQKFLRKVSGEAVPDTISPNYKLASNFFQRFTNQQVQYLLGNGLTLTKHPENKKKLGRDFDMRLVDAAYSALLGGRSFGFWNYDHMRVFDIREFAPLYDEETGALAAGIRFWQLAPDKPMRCTLYEQDGHTEYIAPSVTDMKEYRPKKTYKLTIAHTEADGDEITDGSNYPTLPIVPLKGNRYGQSEIIGVRENIDCYDLIKSGFANDLDEASSIYWILTNTGGMDDKDLAVFLERLKTVKATTVDTNEGVSVEAHTVEVPYEGRTAYLAQLRSDLYEDYQALDVVKMAAGSVTAAQINAAYEPLNEKADAFEYCVLDFLEGIFALAGIEDEATFTRSKIVNMLEETQMVMLAAQELDEETILQKLPFITPEEAEKILKRRQDEDLSRFGGKQQEEPEEELTGDDEE